MLKLRELHGNKCQVLPRHISHGTTFSPACGVEIFWKDIFLKVLRDRGSCGCSATYPHLRVKGSALEELEARYIKEHACTPACMQLEFQFYLQTFNNQQVFQFNKQHSGSIVFDNYLCKYLFKLSLFTLQQRSNPLHLPEILNCCSITQFFNNVFIESFLREVKEGEKKTFPDSIISLQLQ